MRRSAAILALLMVTQQAQAQHNRAEPGLIPFRAASFLPLALKLRKSPEVRILNSTPQLKFDAYTFDYSDGTSATFEALSGDVSFNYPADSRSAPTILMDDESTLATTKSLLVHLGLFDSRFNKSQVSPPSIHLQDDPDQIERERDVRFWEILPGEVQGLNRCSATFDRRRRQIVRVNQRRRSSWDSTLLLSRAKCLEAARWAVTQGRPTFTQVLLPSEMTAEQHKALYDGPMGTIKDESAVIGEDKWFAQRAFRTLDFNTADVTLDAVSGFIERVGASSPTLAGYDFALFKLPEPQTLAKPTWLPDAPQDDGITINFNDLLLRGSAMLGYKALFSPPIIRDGQPLICAEYLPAFLIKHTRQAQVLYLRGLLPKEGKVARLTLGSKQARISGTELELEAAPVEVEGRLYVPASLLQRVNGVLVRWEAKSKTLWIDTRYLRRP